MGKKKRKNKKNKIRYNARRDGSIISILLYKLYAIKSLRKLILKFFYRYVGPHCEYYSQTLRKLFSCYYNVTIGMYSHGSCFRPGTFPPGSNIGNYCSTAIPCRIYNSEYPLNMKSTHPFFFNPDFGYTDSNKISYTSLSIGNDVWLGANCIILPSCSAIGDGAIVGAGAVVDKDVPPYAIAVGNPARVVRFRFSEEIRNKFIEARWWKKNLDEILEEFKEYQTPIEGNSIR